MPTGAERTFDTTEATAVKDLAVALAGYDETYTVAVAGHAETADTDDAASLAGFWNQLESARSDRYADEAAAWADFRAAGYADQATAVATLATTVDTPWAHFEANLAAAKRDWWTAAKPGYLTWVGNVNQEHENYQAAVGTQYVTQVGNIGAASTARWTSIAAAREARAVEEAGDHETYVHAMAGYAETYLVAVAQAKRDLAAGGEGSDYSTAMKTAADAYRSGAAPATGTWKVDLADANKEYADALYGADGCELTWTAARDQAIEDFEMAEANAYADMLADVANLDKNYLTQEAQTYANALAGLAATNGTPWAQLAADEAAAEAARARSKSLVRAGSASAGRLAAWARIFAWTDCFQSCLHEGLLTES